MITLCIADDCPNRGRHEQHAADYAEAAAREWLDEIKINRWDLVDVVGDSLLIFKSTEAELAAIIRKHVADNIDDINGPLMQS